MDKIILTQDETKIFAKSIEENFDNYNSISISLISDRLVDDLSSILRARIVDSEPAPRRKPEDNGDDGIVKVY